MTTKSDIVLCKEGEIEDRRILAQLKATDILLVAALRVLMRNRLLLEFSDECLTIEFEGAGKKTKTKGIRT